MDMYYVCGKQTEPLDVGHLKNTINKEHALQNIIWDKG